MSMRSLLPDLLALVEAATRGAAQGGGSRQVVAAVSAAAIRTVLGLGDACGSSRAVDVDAEVFRSCRSLHDMLAHRLADDRAAHSLGQSIRAAQARGLLQPDMAQRVRRVAQASNALRHVTGASLAKLEQDVEQALGAGEPLCVDPWAGAVFPRARHSRQAAQDPWRFWRPTSAVSDPDCSVPVLDDLLSVTSDVVTNNFDECKTKEIAASVGVAAEDATGIHEVTHFDTSRQDNAQDDRLSVPALVHDFVHMGSAMRDTFNSEVVSAVDEEINLCSNAVPTASSHADTDSVTACCDELQARGAHGQLDALKAEVLKLQSAVAVAGCIAVSPRMLSWLQWSCLAVSATGFACSLAIAAGVLPASEGCVPHCVISLSV